MSDDTKNNDPSITDPHRVPAVFVNSLVGRGFLNGVVNLTFATALFTPHEDKVDPDCIITCRLRMDLYCAQQLRDALDGLIRQNTKPLAAAEH